VADPDTVIDEFFGDAQSQIRWQSEAEKRLHFWFDDLHCPNPISPMWFDVGGWWLTCAYMFRRFGVPFAVDWVAKTVNGRVMTAVVPRDRREAAELAPYYEMVMPVYAERFLDWWKRRYLPEILRNFEYLDGFPAETASLPELMILLEEALDIQERHFRLHWILNLAQLQTSITFEKMFKEMIGEAHGALIGTILTSDEDRNWDSIRDLWKLKERIKNTAALRAAFDSHAGADDVLQALRASPEGREVLAAIDDYRVEYGNRSMYTHEYTSTTWREDPTPIVEALRGYLLEDYNYEADVKQLHENREKAIARMWSLFPAARPPSDRVKLERALELALKMTPLTPDHHFYMDQGTYARVRLVFMAIGRRLVSEGVLAAPDDVFYLRYHELRVLSANFTAFDVKALAKERRDALDAAAALPPRLWCGTITHWSLYEEPYKYGLWGWPDVYTRDKEAQKNTGGQIRGLGASAGVIEGPARLVQSASEFDQVRKGDVLVCKMTNPAWVVLFTKIAGLVTDSGGVLSHPAIVSREFGIPAVVGTLVATERLRTGQIVRVDGGAGTVEVVG
jgi:pyruvate,water dikinase